jgi:F-type H+-transporting ATPase subunit a
VLVIGSTVVLASGVLASDPPATSSHEENVHSDQPAAEEKKEGFYPGELIMDHISDSHEWHFFDFKLSDGSEVHASVCLPLILYTPGEGLGIFSYKKLHHPPYKGYTLMGEDAIVRTDGKKFYDFSLTKNVVSEMIAMVLMLLIFISVARNYKKYGAKAPKGFHSAVEVVVLFIRDQVAKPLLGDKANKYLPYLLTLFFFIWINNLMGLIPGSANVTGNIAVTMTLALITFVLMMAGSTRHYWSHMVAPKGIPYAVWPILIPIEILSNLIVKPVALMIRLFANMLAGHLIVLSFLMLIFIFAAMNLVAGLGASIFSVAFAMFIYLLELLVAALQAYIFTILSALFISETINTGGHAHKESQH